MRSEPVTFAALFIFLYLAWPGLQAHAQQEMAQADTQTGSGAAGDTSGIDLGLEQINEYINGASAGQRDSLPSKFGDAGAQGTTRALENAEARPDKDESGESNDGDGANVEAELIIPTGESHRTIFGQVLADMVDALTPTPSYSPALGDPWIKVSVTKSLTAGGVEVVQTGKSTTWADISYNPVIPLYQFLYVSPKFNTEKEFAGLSVGLGFKDVNAEIGVDFNGRPNIQPSVTVRSFKQTLVIEPDAGTYNAGGELERAILFIYQQCQPSLGACD